MNRLDRLVRFRLRKNSKTIDQSIRFLVSEAAASVPHVRELFASASLQPLDIESSESLALLPVTSRTLLSCHPQSYFLHEQARMDRLLASHTSGSTGTPATIFLSSSERAFRRLLLARAIKSHFPHCLPFRVADIGQATTTGSEMPSFDVGPFHLTRIPGNQPMPEQVRMYISSAPQLLEGYAGCLELLAQELQKQSSYPRPHVVISRGELLLPEARELMEQVYGCPVANFYNSEEVGNIAWECRDRPGILHVNTDACVLELLDSQDVPVAPEIEGRVVITNLYNYSMPFLRYNTGDYATWDNPKPHHCCCGAFTPTLSSIDGRTDDFIILPNHRRISPLVTLTTALNGSTKLTSERTYIDQVRQFQVVQEVDGKVIIHVVPGKRFPSDMQQRLQTAFEQLHKELEIRVVVVDKIDLEPSGKLKRIICRVEAEPHTTK